MVKPPTGKALSFNAFGNVFGALGVTYFQGGAVIVTEIKFGQIAMQMGFAAMLIDAFHATLEHAPNVFDSVGVNVATNILIPGVNDRGMARKLFASLGIDAAFIGVQD